MVISLEDILFLIGSLLLNPLLPSFGIQTAISIAVGMILPQRVVDPINHILHKIPGLRKVACWFEEELKKRLKTTIPRMLAGYLTTSLVGGILLLVALLI